MEKAMALPPVLLPGKSHGRRSLVGCSPWDCEESDMTERLHFHFSLLCIGEGNGNPLQCSCLENPRDGVAQSWTWLKWLSSSRLTCRLLQSKNSTAGHKASVWKLSWKKKCAVLCISFHPGMAGGAQFLYPLRLNWPCHFINRMGEAKLNWF